MQQRLLGLKAVETRLPDAPGELRGTRPSDRIEGMLGSEAAMLLHPAEARLLTCDSEAVRVGDRKTRGLGLGLRIGNSNTLFLAHDRPGTAPGSG